MCENLFSFREIFRGSQAMNMEATLHRLISYVDLALSDLVGSADYRGTVQIVAQRATKADFAAQLLGLSCTTIFSPNTLKAKHNVFTDINKPCVTLHVALSNSGCWNHRFSSTGIRCSHAANFRWRIKGRTSQHSRIGDKYRNIYYIYEFGTLDGAQTNGGVVHFDA